MANFKGFRQVLADYYNGLSAEEKKGYMWLVRESTTSTDGSIYFGTRLYANSVKVDLTNYATKDFVTESLADYALTSEVSAISALVADVMGLVGLTASDESIELILSEYFNGSKSVVEALELLANNILAHESSVAKKIQEIETAVDAADGKGVAAQGAADAALAAAQAAQGDATKALGDAAAAQEDATYAREWVESFLDENGLNDDVVNTLKEIQDYITTDGEAAKKMADDIASKVSKTEYNEKVSEIESALANKLETSDLSEYAKTNDVVLKDGYVAYSETEKTKLSTIESGAQANVIEKVTLFGNELDVTNKTVELDFQSDDITLGVDITTTEKDEETGEMVTKTVFSKETTVSETLQGIYASLKSGLSGGVTSVTAADDSIIVGGDTNTKTVKVQISNAADNRLTIRTVDGEKGLYVEPLYYEGNDVEE